MPVGDRGRQGRNRHGRKTASAVARSVGAGVRRCADRRMAQQVAVLDAVPGGGARLEFEHEAHWLSGRDDRLGLRLTPPDRPDLGLGRQKIAL